MKSLEQLDKELADELVKEKKECENRIHDKLLSLELMKNGMEPIISLSGKTLS